MADKLDDIDWPAPAGDPYDRLAPWYEEDMGASMRFDDVSFYRGLAAKRGGRTLELGCGTGRILRPLAMAGIAMSGIDRSAESLRRLQAQLAADNLSCPLAEADVTRKPPPDWLPFDTILLPYSLVTYWTDAYELQRAWAFVTALAKPGTQLVVDAFLPRPVTTASTGFSLDYQRQTPRGALSRWKRITPLDDGRNQIERRYQIETAGRVERFQTVERIHPWHPGAIARMAIDAGFQHSGTFYDYGAAAGESAAQFATGIFLKD